MASLILWFPAEENDKLKSTESKKKKSLVVWVRTGALTLNTYINPVRISISLTAIQNNIFL